MTNPVGGQPGEPDQHVADRGRCGIAIRTLPLTPDALAVGGRSAEARCPRVPGRPRPAAAEKQSNACHAHLFAHVEQQASPRSQVTELRRRVPLAGPGLVRPLVEYPARNAWIVAVRRSIGAEGRDRHHVQRVRHSQERVRHADCWVSPRGERGWSARGYLVLRYPGRARCADTARPAGMTSRGR